MKGFKREGQTMFYKFAIGNPLYICDFLYIFFSHKGRISSFGLLNIKQNNLYKPERNRITPEKPLTAVTISMGIPNKARS